MGKLVSMLYKVARIANDIETLSSLKPDRIARRVVNKQLSRKLGSKLFIRGTKRK